MKVIAVDFVCYEVSDVARSVEFYRDVVGLTPGMVEMGEEFQWAEFEIGSVTLSLYPPKLLENRDPKPGGMVYLAVDDVPAAVEELKAKGVSILYGPMETPVCFMAGFLDPDGNQVGLHQRKDGTAG
ncbi:VOC family protein [Ruficoccus amylovorans]|uniref:VOC family protein n=1 Tax=Ruficoccus amylovorans TaxID=1804625 RepID=A0A842HHQ8_9BACT|nr:VOC family protein [Ruficoccus amylovorans]MBC2596063.1 VOC family protein [Ruficoccus amylovorans]